MKYHLLSFWGSGERNLLNNVNRDNNIERIPRLFASLPASTIRLV